MSAIMNVRLSGNGNIYDVSDFSFNWPLDAGISWNASLAERIGDFSSDEEFRLIVNGWRTPPLVCAVSRETWGIGIGEKSEITGIDLYHFKASKQGTDLPVFQGKKSDEIAATLASTVSVPISNVPSYKIPEYKADKGKVIEHIGRVYRDGGFGYKVTNTGIYGWPMLQHTPAGYGQNWIKTFERTRNAAEKITSIKIEKTSPVQSRFEFTFESTGYKTVSFPTALQSVLFKDESTYGYIDEIAFFNGSNVAQSGQVGGTTITMPHPGVVYPPGHAAGPIKSAALTCYAPQNISTTDVLCVAVFEGIPRLGAWYDGIELAFTTSYSTGETPERPAPDVIDGTLMPSKAHADSIKEALFFDRNKKSETYILTCPDLIPIFEPGESLVVENKTLRIENVAFSAKSGTTLTCVVMPV